MPDRAELVERDELEALRRRSRGPGSSQAAPVADDPTIDLPAQSRRTGPGSSAAVLSRAMGPASFMAMQRLAGNRAMLQALARAQVSLLRDTADPQLEEEKPAGGASPAEPLALPGQAGAAAGAPNGTAGSGQQGGAGEGSVAGGSAEPSTQGGRGRNGQDLEKPAVSSGGDAASTAGQAGAAIGGAEAGAAGESAGAAAGAGATGAGATAGGEAAGAAAVGAAGAGPAGEAAGGAAGTAVGGGSGAAAGAAAGAAIGGASGSGASAGGGSTDVAAGAGAPGGGTAGSSRSRKAEAPPITGSGGPSTPRAGSGPSTGSGGVPAGGGPGQAGAGPGPATTLDATGSGPASPVGAAPAAADGNGTSGVSDPTTAKTGIDWNQMLSDFGPPARTILEVGRLIPGWGLVAGLASDSLSFASDLSSIPTSKNARFATDLVIFRNIVNILNNGLGHVLYVNQLIQDGLAGSVVGAEFTPLTAAANEVLSGVKVALDEVQLGTDVVVEVEAQYQANHAPDSTEAEAWKALADNYAANILGDVVNTILDLISLASAGAANTAPVEEAKLPLTLAGAFLEHAAPNIISAINNVVGVWLGTGVTAGRHAATGTPAAAGASASPSAGAGGGPAPAPGAGGAGSGSKVQRMMGASPGDTSGPGGRAARLQAQAAIFDVAGGFIDIEAPQARATYDGMNVVIGAFEAYAEDQVAQIDAVVGALSGGKSAFQVIRDAVKAGLDDMNAKLGMAQQLGETATNAKANAASISAACTTVLAGIDGL
ncbi:MAG TPA: hypothetical protein VF323_03850, partial [Candidatus Limnocylindrales bacterium]